VSSSVGSFISPMVDRITRQRPWLLPAALVGLLALYAAALSPLLSMSLGMGIWTRRLLVPAVLLPLGFVMGVPFPLGLSRVTLRVPGLVPLAWGVNGCASVLAASTALLASMEFGFGALQLLAIVAYAAAFGVAPEPARRVADASS